MSFRSLELMNVVKVEIGEEQCSEGHRWHVLWIWHQDSTKLFLEQGEELRIRQSQVVLHLPYAASKEPLAVDDKRNERSGDV